MLLSAPTRCSTSRHPTSETPDLRAPDLAPNLKAPDFKAIDLKDARPGARRGVRLRGIRSGHPTSAFLTSKAQPYHPPAAVTSFCSSTGDHALLPLSTVNAHGLRRSPAHSTINAHVIYGSQVLHGKQLTYSATSDQPRRLTGSGLIFHDNALIHTIVH